MWKTALRYLFNAALRNPVKTIAAETTLETLAQGGTLKDAGKKSTQRVIEVGSGVSEAIGNPASEFISGAGDAISESLGIKGIFSKQSSDKEATHPQKSDKDGYFAVEQFINNHDIGVTVAIGGLMMAAITEHKLGGLLIAGLAAITMKLGLMVNQGSHEAATTPTQQKLFTPVILS